tara:strand:- start:176 stop:400 length:225 start_codon:yes stop_codon:yes gene_type:complete
MSGKRSKQIRKVAAMVERENEAINAGLRPSLRQRFLLWWYTFWRGPLQGTRRYRRGSFEANVRWLKRWYLTDGR